MLINQPGSHRLGTILLDLLACGEWTRVTIAVAWVRRSGTRHLLPSFRKFLADEHLIRIVTGVDIENTSREGLEDLLSTTADGDCETFVYHNEARTTYHPKVYLFENATRAKLIIGSNNLTEPGLFTNTEASLMVEALTTDQLILDARIALDAWFDTSEGLCHKLDADLITKLVDGGYVLSESTLSMQRAAAKKNKAGQDGGKKKARLFGSKIVSAPAPPDRTATGLSEEDETENKTSRPAVSGTLRLPGLPTQLSVTNVLLMRIRPARGGTQIQIPIPLQQSDFFQGATSIISGHDSTSHPISATRPARSGGTKINTYKLEVPEAEGLKEPVMLLERSSLGITYFVYDASSSQGRPIMDSLVAGFGTVTALTKPNDKDHCTWYRFI